MATTDLEQLRQWSDALEDRPVWDKFGEEDPASPEQLLEQYYKLQNPGPNPAAALYTTTNSEYGRFQTSGDGQTAGRVPDQSDVDRSLELLGSRRSERDPVASARSRAESVLREEQERADSQRAADTGSAPPPTAGIRLPAVYGQRYMPLRSAEEGGDDSPDRRRLTTGYAKSYMSQSHAPFWGNIQTVAPGAGFDTAPKSGRPDTQVLTIDRAGDNTDDLIAEIMAGLDRGQSEEVCAE